MIKAITKKSIQFNGSILSVNIGDRFPFDELLEQYPSVFVKDEEEVFTFDEKDVEVAEVSAVATKVVVEDKKSKK